MTKFKAGDEVTYSSANEGYTGIIKRIEGNRLWCDGCTDTYVTIKEAILVKKGRQGQFWHH